ncbi:hypothetical protein BV22DRAFT_1195502 [Leucogyrophana mollusca]|uniref:Uncharacterized protein n=1 Tax=Leucogyrophana mollusca TaxID=85980 RepID=A0ACB8BGT9_9AGAM|nr:hypothetical protein BV22DRAFT_1195502 [Leucogyrophana mollusca]
MASSPSSHAFIDSGEPFRGQPLRRQPSSSYLQGPPVWSDLALLSDESRETIENERRFRGEPPKAGSRRCSLVPQFTTPQLRNTCYSLHVLLVVIHCVLLGLAIRHVEHRLVFAITSKSSTTTTILSVSLQSFYTVYTATMLFVTQRVALSRALSQRQKLTALHDTSGAWTGLGSALFSMWQQTSVAASTWRTSAIVAYLTCISILHITSSSIIQLQTFDNIVSVKVPTAVGWPDPSADLSNMHWSSISSLVPLIPFYADSTAGVSNDTVYDILSPNDATGNATVNATTVRITCGLIPTANFSYLFDPDLDTSVHEYIYGPPSSSSTYNETYDGRMIGFYPVTVPWKNQVLFYPSMYALFSESPLLFLVSASIETASSLNTEVALRMNWTYSNNASLLQEEIDVYLVGCSLSTLSHNATVDVQSNKLLEVSPIPERPSRQWSILDWTPVTVPTSVTDAWTSEPFIQALPANMSMVCDELSYYGQDCYSPTVLDVYFMESLGFNETVWSADTADTSGPIQNEATNVYADLIPLVSVGTVEEFENSLSNMFALFIWIAGQFGGGDVGQGFQRSDGETTAVQPVLEWRLNINPIPVSSPLSKFSTLIFFLGDLKLSVAMAASLIALGLAAQMIRRTGHGLHQDPKVQSFGVLELIWLAARVPALKEGMETVEDPTTENLRIAGMFDVCFGEVFGEAEETTSE